MRILIINSYYHPNSKGGAEVVVKLLSEGLASQGHAVFVASTIGVGELVVEENINNVHAIRLPTKNLYWPFLNLNPAGIKKLFWHVIDNWNPFAAHQIKNVLREVNPDLVVTHNLAGFSTSVWGAVRKVNKPILHVVHDYYLTCVKSSMFSSNHPCLKPCNMCSLLRVGIKNRSNKLDAVIFVSEYLKNKFEALGLFKSVPKHVVHNSINLIPKSTKKPLSSKSKIVLGFIGRVTQEKGIETVLSAYCKLSQLLKDDHIDLLIAGEVSDDYLIILKTKYGGKAQFLGKTSPEDFFKNIDVCVVPPLWDEPFGLVAVEALCFGVPVIASDSGGLMEIVKDGYNGLIFRKGDVEDLIEKLQLFISDDNLSALLKSNTELSSAIFTDVSSFISKHADIYSSIVKSYHQSITS